MSKPLRQFMFETLEAGRVETPAGRLADIAIVSLISLNVLAVILESVPDIGAPYRAFFLGFEVFSVGIFTIEYLLRVWSVPEHPGLKYAHPVIGRLRYMMTPLALIDLAVILPFYLLFFVHVDLRVLRVVRLFRLFRLTRYSTSVNLLGQVLRSEAPNIAAALFVLLMLIVLAASVAYLAEHNVQPDVFGSIPEALWWAVITMTTIGYGDVVPMTPVGKLCGAVVGVISVGMVALPAGILASGFNEALHRRRREFTDAVHGAFTDGTISEEERERLRTVQETLGLSETEAASILRAVYHQRRDRPPEICPHCGRPIGHAPPGSDPPPPPLRPGGPV